MKRKRDEINRCNIKDFCMRDIDVECEESCARIDSVLIKRKDSKGHLQGKELYVVSRSLIAKLLLEIKGFFLKKVKKKKK